jgi:hypothetical protein
MNPAHSPSDYERWLEALDLHNPLWFVDHAQAQVKDQVLATLVTGGSKARAIARLRESAATSLMAGVHAHCVAEAQELRRNLTQSAKSVPAGPPEAA